MIIERDYTAERLARITVLFDETKRAKAQMAVADRPLAGRLILQLDQMLNELRPPDFRRKS